MEGKKDTPGLTTEQVEARMEEYGDAARRWKVRVLGWGRRDDGEPEARFGALSSGRPLLQLYREDGHYRLLEVGVSILSSGASIDEAMGKVRLSLEGAGTGLGDPHWISRDEAESILRAHGHWLSSGPRVTATWEARRYRITEDGPPRIVRGLWTFVFPEGERTLWWRETEISISRGPLGGRVAHVPLTTFHRDA